MYETYSNKLNIEAQTLKNMSRQLILPSALKTKALLSGGGSTGITNMDKVLGGQIGKAYEQTEELSKVAKEANNIDHHKKKARFQLEKVLPAMASLRETLDDIEGRVDRKDWPFATYSEMLFRKH